MRNNYAQIGISERDVRFLNAANVYYILRSVLFTLHQDFKAIRVREMSNRLRFRGKLVTEKQYKRRLRISERGKKRKKLQSPIIKSKESEKKLNAIEQNDSNLSSEEHTTNILNDTQPLSTEEYEIFNGVNIKVKNVNDENVKNVNFQNGDNENVKIVNLQNADDTNVKNVNMKNADDQNAKNVNMKNVDEQNVKNVNLKSLDDQNVTIDNLKNVDDLNVKNVNNQNVKNVNLNNVDDQVVKNVDDQNVKNVNLKNVDVQNVKNVKLKNADQNGKTVNLKNVDDQNVKKVYVKIENVNNGSDIPQNISVDEMTNRNMDVNKVSNCAVTEIMDGRRIIEFAEIGKQLWCVVCKEALSLQYIENEARRGLGSILSVRCHKCQILNTIMTGKQHTSPDGRINRFDINSELVFGMLNAGIGWTHLNKILGCLNIPTISFSTFKRYEQEVRCVIQQQAEEDYLKSEAIKSEFAI